MELELIDEVKDNFQIMKPRLKDPSIVIFNVTDELTNEEFIEGLKSQNEDLANDTLRTLEYYNVSNVQNTDIQLRHAGMRSIRLEEAIAYVGALRATGKKNANKVWWCGVVLMAQGPIWPYCARRSLFSSRIKF
ncbi:hypothetical protein AVEN_57288-1 [Araneus ventricosus]|uniref:Uncharacterized protein n=1 Tax=Araneus ventricosus TaxID=182803 RepID=A0A4Y2IT85_ARAVE|nr:hypothetical protein AVEN_57288-1 [Araneus ventricosus]